MKVVDELSVRVLLAQDSQNLVPVGWFPEAKDALALHIAMNCRSNVEEPDVLDIDKPFYSWC